MHAVWDRVIVFRYVIVFLHVSYLTGRNSLRTIFSSFYLHGLSEIFSHLRAFRSTYSYCCHFLRV